MSDTTRPSTPTNLTVAGVLSTQVNLSWTNSTDNVGVTEYALERCLGVSCTDFAQVGTTTGVTFPVVSQNVLLYPELARRIVEEGHTIGNHTWDHQDLTTLTDEQIDQEISNTQNIIFQTTGVTLTFFRPPYESVNATVESRIRAAGLHTTLWTEDTNDWAGATANDIFWTITTMQNGGIVLMHDQMPATAAAIPDIAWYLKSYWAGNNICAGKLAPTTHVVPMDDWWGMFFFVHAVPWR